MALALGGCASGTTDDCGKVCSVRQGTAGPIDAEGGPLSASCSVGFTCNAASSVCVANDGRCTSTSPITTGTGTGTDTTTSAASTGGTGTSSGTNGTGSGTTG